MTTFAFDANIVSAILKGNTDLQNRLQQELFDGNCVVIPPVVLYEIRRWLLFNKSGKRTASFEKLCNGLMIDDMRINSFEIAAAEHARLKSDDYTLDDADLFIAGFCIDNSFVLVTNNTKHFNLFNGLRAEDWTQA